MTDRSALDAVLAGYAAGSLPEPARVLIESHLTLSTENRGFVRDLETLGGEELEALPPVPLTDRDRRLAQIFAMPDDPIVAREPASGRGAAPPTDLPRPLRDFLGRDLGDIPWKTLLPGVREFKLSNVDGCTASLYWIRAGQPLPSHTHKGSEITLVLKGGFADAFGHWGRGEVAVADDEVDHKPVADADEDCICFAVTDAPLRLTGPIGRLLSRFMR